MTDEFFLDDDVQRRAVDILKACSADIKNDDKALWEVLDPYARGTKEDVLELVSTSLSINSLLIETLAKLKRLTAEEVIDQMFLEVS